MSVGDAGCGDGGLGRKSSVVCGLYLPFLNSKITEPDSKDTQVWNCPVGTLHAKHPTDGPKR